MSARSLLALASRATHHPIAVVLGVVASALALSPASAAPPTLAWLPVATDADVMPGSTRLFNSYNQPSVDASGLVVFRARAKGPGEPPHGVFTRDMAAGGAITRIFDRTTTVPPPNPTARTFTEFPSFPRIDRDSPVIATRGNHPPIATSPDGEPLGTTGIFATPGGLAVTAAAQLAAVPGYAYFAVPGAAPGTRFDVFPGAPAVTDGGVIAFKGNYTEDGIGKTGVYYRELDAATAGGTAPIELLANTGTQIPGAPAGMTFGSTAPPSAADGQAVFTGLDDEDAPTAGGIYLVPLEPSPELTTLVAIGARVPDWKGRPTGEVFSRLGEGLSFDGRFVAFWGAWGTAQRTVTVHCPTEGNAARRAACLAECPEPAGCTRTVPLHQGVFVHDTWTGSTREAAETGARYVDFLFWNFSGKVEGGPEDDGEPARWRAASFIAIDAAASGEFQVAFEARTGAGTTIDLATGPGQSLLAPVTVVATGSDGGVLDPAADGLPVAALGLERDGFRHGWLAISARMGSEVEGAESEGWAGIYVTRVPPSFGR